jgi:3-deoxy-7-phosphoheptulonate synthase
VIAGPCAVESEEQILRIAEAVKKAGAQALRGGAFKPRTSPHYFQGHGEKALRWLAKARELTGLPVVTEAVDEESLRLVVQYADVIQIGTRNSQNFALLKAVGKTQKPVLLKRGMAQDVDELISAAEHIMVQGNMNVILCERGIRTFGNHIRAMLDIAAITVAKSMSCLPIIADPSHAAGDVKFVPPLAKAALAGGAGGLIIEVHNNPSKALCDAKQQLDLNQFSELMDELRAMKLV